MTANGCGTHGRWKAGCPVCQRISRTYERKRRLARQAGTWKPQVPQELVQAHIDRLLADGANMAGIAQESGLSTSTLFGIRQRIWVQGDTAAAVFAVASAPAVPPSGMVPAIGACRRVRALVAAGWSLTEQGRQLGMRLQQVWQVAAGKHSAVTETHDEAIRDLFERLCTTDGGSTRARNDARRKGWLPPLAWDDIDDPDAEPSLGESRDDVVDEVAIERALAGDAVDLTDAELVVVLQAGTARGESLAKLSKQFGLNYWGARKMLGGEFTPRREKQARVEAELLRVGDRQDDYVIAVSLGVHRSTVSRARARLADAARSGVA